MYRFFSEVAGARIETVRYDEAMRFPLEATLRALKRAPRILVHRQSEQSDGHAARSGGARRILDAAPQTLVLVDEAYFEFCGVTVLPWIRTRPNLVVSRTFSKAAGLAALRLGALFARADLADAMRRAFTPYPVNSVALGGGRGGASRTEDFFAGMSRRCGRAAGSLRKGSSDLARAFSRAARILYLLISAPAAAGWCGGWRGAGFWCATARRSLAATVSCASPRARRRRRSACWMRSRRNGEVRAQTGDFRRGRRAGGRARVVSPLDHRHGASISRAGA